ncbi:MAG: hypothetical protein U0840_02085 [Gemmataceae bacterium]
MHRKWLAVILIGLAGATGVRAHLVPRPLGAVRVNLCLKGQLIDHTANHGVDHRFWAPALCQKRDMYVYLPPGYDARKCYPLCIYLHGFLSDEINFLELVVKPLDRAIAKEAAADDHRRPRCDGVGARRAGNEGDVLHQQQAGAVPGLPGG